MKTVYTKEDFDFVLQKTDAYYSYLINKFINFTWNSPPDCGSSTSPAREASMRYYEHFGNLIRENDALFQAVKDRYSLEDHFQKNHTSFLLFKRDWGWSTERFNNALTGQLLEKKLFLEMRASTTKSHLANPIFLLDDESSLKKIFDLYVYFFRNYPCVAEIAEKLKIVAEIRNALNQPSQDKTHALLSVNKILEEKKSQIDIHADKRFAGFFKILLFLIRTPARLFGLHLNDHRQSNGEKFRLAVRERLGSSKSEEVQESNKKNFS